MSASPVGTSWTACAIAAAVAWVSLCGPVSAQERAARHNTRPWRIAVNDDGEVPIPGPKRTLQQFLEPKFNDVIGTQVDAYFLCLGSTDRHVPPSRARLQDTMNQWAHDGKAPDHLDAQIRTYLAAAHKAGLTVFLSVRMNDIHDAWAKQLTYPLKVKRPDLLIGQKRHLSKDTLMSAHWSALNWAEPEVRQHFLGFIIWCCRRYEFDGVELDWFRHPLHLKLGEEQQNIEPITGFVRQVHKGLDAIAADRGKPYLLTVRTVDTPEQSLRTGLDVEQWLKEGLLDMLMVGGGYLPYGARLKRFIDMAHRYHVPAYPAMNHFKDPELMRTVASNFFALGADGFYIFNWYGVPDGSEKAKCLTQCGSPETLAGLDKRYIADNGCRIRYCGYSNPPSQFPSPLVGGRAIELVVGDDVAKAQQEGKIAAMTLRITVSSLDAGATLSDLIHGVRIEGALSVQVNAAQIAADAIQFVSTAQVQTKLWPASLVGEAQGHTFAAAVTAPPIRRGINHIRVFPGPHSSGPLRAAVAGMELVVDYVPAADAPATQAPAAPQGPRPGQRVVKPTSGVPLSLYAVPVGSKRALTFDLDVDPKDVKTAQLGLNAEDFDSREEVRISFNASKPLVIPDSLLSDTGSRVGFVNVPVALLRSGKNTVLFTFASNLNGTTKGFDVAEALLVLKMK